MARFAFAPPAPLVAILSDQAQGEFGVPDDEPVRVLAIAWDPDGAPIEYLVFHPSLQHPRAAKYRDVQRIEYGVEAPPPQKRGAAFL